MYFSERVYILEKNYFNKKLIFWKVLKLLLLSFFHIRPNKKVLLHTQTYFLILSSHSFTTMESKNMSAYVVKLFCLAEYEKMTVIKALVLSEILTVC